MKVCETCGNDIDGARDGENTCRDCDEFATIGVVGALQAAKRRKRNASRRARENALRSCGLVKVRGALGGTYWE
jgi:hypothetical protein